MPKQVSAAAAIVARYLKANNYDQTLNAFIEEAGLSQDAGESEGGDLTLETLLEEKNKFDISLRFEKLGVEDDKRGWSKPAPSTADVVKTLPSTSNILYACASRFVGEDGSLRPVLLASTADRKLHLLNPSRTRALEQSLSCSHDSPILSHTEFRGHLLTSSMSGQLHLSKINGETLEGGKRRDHTKYIVKTIVHYDDQGDALIATAGWDGKVVIYKPDSSTPPRLGEPFATIALLTKPESIVFLQHPDSRQPVLLVSRTDSTCIYYYSVEAQPRLLGQQNLAPHSNAWVAFTPSSIEPCPTDPTLIAVGTSSIPHMKLMIVRTLFPPWSETLPSEAEVQVPLRTSLLDESPAALTQASQARAALAIAEREAAAIQIHCSTLAPQTTYSTPAVAWRPDGSGVWVNGDDGVVRGIEAISGKIVATLRGHEPGSKVRCLWSGAMEVEGRREEYLVSGGFDQQLIVWIVGQS